MCPGSKDSQAASGVNRDVAFGLWEGIVPHSSILVRLHLGTASSFEHTNARKRLINRSEFSIVSKLIGV